jgi:hypothetical protein
MAAVARVRHNTTILLGTVIAALGAVLIVSTVARGGGPTATGIVVGAALLMFGCARVYLAAGMRSHDRS